MADQTPPPEDIVLIGAGHTNLHVVREWRTKPIPNARLTLISPFGQATYSGMLPGTLAGLYQPLEMQIDLERFTAGTDIRLIIAAATGLNPAQRLITFATRAPLCFDIASVGIGSIPSRHEVWQHSPRVLSIKPMATFLARLDAAAARYRSLNAKFHCVIVGSGAAGTEIAFCLDAWLRRHRARHTATSATAAITAGQGNAPGHTADGPYQITLVDGNPEVLPGYLPALARRVRKLFDQRGIQLQLGHRAERIVDTGSGSA